MYDIISCVCAQHVILFCPIRSLLDFLPVVNLVGQRLIYPLFLFFFLFVYLAFLKWIRSRWKLRHLSSLCVLLILNLSVLNTSSNNGIAHVTETFPDVLNWKPVFSDSTVLYEGETGAVVEHGPSDAWTRRSGNDHLTNPPGCGKASYSSGASHSVVLLLENTRGPSRSLLIPMETKEMEG